MTDTTQNFTKFEDFEYFGKLAPNKSPSPNVYSSALTTQNCDTILENIIISILNGNYAKTSQLEINMLVCVIVSKNVTDLHNILIRSINKFVTCLRDEIQERLDSKTFANSYFFDNYNKYIKNMYHLKNSFGFAYDYLKTVNKKNVITIYGNYIYYLLIINKEFLNCGMTMYIYEILLNNNKKEDIVEFFTLFKLSNHFLALAYSIEDVSLRTILFNNDLSNIIKKSDRQQMPEFVNTLTDEINEFITQIMKKVNDSIKYTNENDLNDQIKELSKKSIDYIKMCISVCEPTTVMVYYLKHLQERILNNSTNINIENEFVKAFNYKTNSELYIKMRMCINDVVSSNIINESISKISSIKFKDKKYESFDSSVIDRKKCKYLVVRQYAWNDGTLGSLQYTRRINEPLEVCAYIDTLNAFLKHPSGSYFIDYQHRSLIVDYDNSTCDFSMTLNNKTYNFKSTLMQYMLLSVINQYYKISADDLRKTLGCPLKQLTNVINSLISIGLIQSCGTNKSDVNMTFELKQNYDGENDTVSLIDVLNDVKKGITSSNVQKSNVLNAKIINFFANNKTTQFDFDGAYSMYKNNNKNDVPTPSQFLNSLQDLIKSNILVFTNDQYMYCNDQISDDSDDDIDENNNDADRDDVDKDEEEKNEEYKDEEDKDEEDKDDVDEEEKDEEEKDDVDEEEKDEEEKDEEEKDEEEKDDVDEEEKDEKDEEEKDEKDEEEKDDVDEEEKDEDEKDEEEKDEEEKDEEEKDEEEKDEEEKDEEEKDEEEKDEEEKDDESEKEKKELIIVTNKNVKDFKQYIIMYFEKHRSSKTFTELMKHVNKKYSVSEKNVNLALDYLVGKNKLLVNNNKYKIKN